MPEHASWFTLLLAHVRDTLSHNAAVLGHTVLNDDAPTWMDFEPVIVSLFVAVLLIVLGGITRTSLADADKAVVPEERLTTRTFMEAFLGYFYDLAKSVMDADRAKKYFPIIGTGALFVFFANVMALIPGAPVATSNLNITLGCAAVVFIVFNYYGLKEQGWGYLKHLAGPAWYLVPLIFPIELISLCVRPITLAVRLMLNMAVDHLILGIFIGLVGLLIPLPVMILGCLIILIQTLVFSLLTCIYIGLATEHEAH